MKTKLPTIQELSTIIKCLKKCINDECIQDGDILPSIDITIGYTSRTNGSEESWDYQVGDNSYSGSAYFHLIWATTSIYRRSNSKELAKELISQLSDSYYLEDYDIY